MFIWDFVAAKVLGQIVDWFYSQIVGFLGNFFSEMGNMGAELFTMEYDDSIVRQMVECIKVYPGGKLEIIFGGGYLVEESV